MCKNQKKELLNLVMSSAWIIWWIIHPNKALTGLDAIGICTVTRFMMQHK